MGGLRSVGVATLAALIGSVATARADRIVVRNGSLVKGKAIIDEAHPDQYLIFGEKGKTPLILKRDRVERIEPEPSVLDGYADQRKGMVSKPSAQAEYDLGVWCQEHKLTDLASLHYESAVKRDPGFAPAHARLGHVNHDGKWLTPNELKLAQGYVLFKGRWITPEEKEQRDLEASATAEQKVWTRRLAILKQAMIAGPEVRSREAEGQVLEIRDASAVQAVARVFGGDGDPEFRKLAVKVLGGIPGPEASSALVGRLLAETDEGVRVATMEQLARSPEPNVVPKLIEALRSNTLVVINRAAWGLANLNAVKAVPKLIPVLLSTEYETAWVDPGGSSNTQTYGVGGMPAAGYAGYTGGQSIPILTGPTVGPGVVAFGATSIPAYALGTGASLSVGQGGGGRGPIPTYIAYTRRNTEVLSALVKLTGKDFGYDVPTWKRWLSTAYQPEPVPAKRVPQP